MALLFSQFRSLVLRNTEMRIRSFSLLSGFVLGLTVSPTIGLGSCWVIGNANCNTESTGTDFSPCGGYYGGGSSGAECPHVGEWNGKDPHFPKAYESFDTPGWVGYDELPYESQSTCWVSWNCTPTGAIIDDESGDRLCEKGSFSFDVRFGQKGVGAACTPNPNP
jgi:hypothetical protein